MAAPPLAAHTPGGQHVVLQALVGTNPERGNAAEWTETELAARCAELCGKACQRQAVGATLRSSLSLKGLVTSRKDNFHLLVWVPTDQARAHACSP